MQRTRMRRLRKVIIRCGTEALLGRTKPGDYAGLRAIAIEHCLFASALSITQSEYFVGTPLKTKEAAGHESLWTGMIRRELHDFASIRRLADAKRRGIVIRVAAFVRMRHDHRRIELQNQFPDAGGNFDQMFRASLIGKAEFAALAGCNSGDAQRCIAFPP